MSMGQIIYCSDLVLRIDSEEEVHNITGTIHILRNQIFRIFEALHIVHIANNAKSLRILYQISMLFLNVA